MPEKLNECLQWHWPLSYLAWRLIRRGLLALIESVDSKVE